MINMYTKFEVFSLRRSRENLGHLLGDLRVTHSVHLWLDGERAVDFLLAIIAVLSSSYGCGTIKRNLSKSAFSDGGGSL